MSVDTVLFHQFLMISTLGDAVVRHDQDLVRTADGGEAVSDGDGGTVFRQRVQAHLNPVFAFIVQRAGCLVQNQYGRIFQENAGDGNALFLAAGEAGASFTRVRVLSSGPGCAVNVEVR